MKTNTASNGQRQSGGFTLIEMIGVLAVIAILAALLLPKVANAISEAKVNSTVGTYQSIQTAATDHYGKFQAFNVVSNTTTVATAAQLAAWDTSVLIPEGFMDKPFSPKIGLTSGLHVVTGANANGGSGYNFANSSASENDTAGMAYVVEIGITNVSPQDAYDLSLAIDGINLSSTNITSPDALGKVTYDGSSVVHMYVIGR
jgi:prepilin-type N-terminal cleavage/methylation domain-containing protein